MAKKKIPDSDDDDFVEEEEVYEPAPRLTLKLNPRNSGEHAGGRDLRARPSQIKQPGRVTRHSKGNGDEFEPAPVVSTRKVKQELLENKANQIEKTNGGQAEPTSDDLGGYSKSPENENPSPQLEQQVEIVSGSEFDGIGSEDNARVSETSYSEDEAHYDPDAGTKSRKGKGKQVAIHQDDEYEDAAPRRPMRAKSSRRTYAYAIDDSDDSDDRPVNRKSTVPGSARKHGYRGAYIVDDDQEEDIDSEADYEADGGKRRKDLERAEKQRKLQMQAEKQARAKMERSNRSIAARSTRNSGHAQDLFELDENGRVVERQTRFGEARNRILLDSPSGTATGEEMDGDGKQYTFRQRKKQISYAIPTIDDITDEVNRNSNDRRNANRPQKIIRRPKAWPLNMSGRQLENFFGGRPVGNKNAANDSSDDDFATPRKRAIGGGLLGGNAGGMFAGGAMSSGMDLAGTPSNLGKIGGNLADTDPLLPQSNVSFDSVGGMEHHIQQLKEMVSLPLLYPEVFQRFNITPPRGVLFHGPPGTGKTLLARALAASCSTEGQKISFFMRKGADCLSKWVGEAERQLRLLFEEAKQCQPSIIFFDEIDGLAPVRSSKQEQIHASIVSTLLALMDGMDGRGQVVVIGATNRPDAVDPALRRPGRFDREFYFPLPNREARRAIIDIHTKGWEPGLESDFKDELAVMTKGYGGADMRALCTEAALYAVQRKYPQIYKSIDRLLIKPETIQVSARDFMLSAKNLIPSTARSTSTLAASLPEHLIPILQPALDQAKTVLGRIIPSNKRASALEDAEFVQDESSFAKEKAMQTFETLRIYRPRLLLCGSQGMGQATLASAIFHHLEGYHVQSFDLGTLISDSTRSPESAIVQLFTEARRHKPSIIHIPSLGAWAEAMSETSKATMQGLLESLDPSEPVLLMASVSGDLKDVSPDVRSWFGFVKANRIMLDKPNTDQRRTFFSEVVDNIQRPPAEFFDALPRRKRKLPVLPKAPAPAPRAMTEAELQQQAQNDHRLREMFKFKLGPIVQELKKRFKRFCKPIGDDYVPPREVTPTPAAAPAIGDEETANSINPTTSEPPIVSDGPTATEKVTLPKYVPVDLDVIHHDLYYDYYLTVDEAMADIQHIVGNASLDVDPEQQARAGQMLNYARVMVDQTFDQQFRVECARMAVRERERLGALKAKRRAQKEKQKEAAAKEAESLAAQAIDAEDTVENRLKRARSDDAEASGSPSHKKSRSNEDLEMDLGAPSTLDLTLPPFTVALTNGASPNGLVQPTGAVLPQVNGNAVAGPSTISPNLENPPANKENSTMDVDAQLPEITLTSEKSPSPEPEAEPEPHPPFHVPEASLQSLKYALESNTADCTIEQMEQLRAMCFEATWRSRKEWDRTELVSEIQNLVADFAEECSEWAKSRDL